MKYMRSPGSKEIALGITSSLFFSITFILNRAMSLEGGSWIWSASLRFYWMLPLFAIIVVVRKNIRGLLIAIKNDLVQWIIWSTTGFGIFYGFLTFAAAYGPSWLVASTWQVTIIAGLIISIFINPANKSKHTGLFTSFLFSGIILLGIIIAQVNHAEIISISDLLWGVLPVVIAAFAYPLGNRKLMQLTKGRLDVYQRILGMLICSMPFWILLSSYELFVRHNAPAGNQYLQTFVVALTSGLIATVLFFSATEKVRNDEPALAAVEATQSTEVVFALAGEVWLLNKPLPDIYGIAGMTFVVLGMILHSLRGRKNSSKLN